MLLQNDGKGRFTDVGRSAGPYFKTKRSGRGLAILDYDNDGDVDVLISHVDLEAAPALLRNDGSTGNHWLGVTLTGKNGLTSGLGAFVKVSAGGREQVVVNQWSTGYLSNSDPRIHLGLGKSSRIERLEVTWPDGSIQAFENLATDRYITIDKEKGLVTK